MHRDRKTTRNSRRRLVGSNLFGDILSDLAPAVAGTIGIAASANIEILDPITEGLNIVQKRVDNVKIETALSNSFGFGGTNATLALSTKNL